MSNSTSCGSVKKMSGGGCGDDGRTEVLDAAEVDENNGKSVDGICTVEGKKFANK